MSLFTTSVRVTVLSSIVAIVLPHGDATAGGKRLGFLDSMMCWVTGEKPNSQENSDAWADILATLETAKLRGEDTLHRSLSRAQEGTIFPVEHNAVMTAYSERRLEMNGLIERIKGQLITSGSDGSALVARLHAELARMADNDQILVQRSTDTRNPVVMGLVTTVVGNTIEGFISAGAHSWMHMKQEQKRMLLEQLEAKKWRAAPTRFSVEGTR